MALILVLRFFILCAQLGYELIPEGRPRILTLICTRQACRRVVRNRGIQNMSNIRFVLICYNYLYSYTVTHMIPGIVKSSSFFIGPKIWSFFLHRWSDTPFLRTTGTSQIREHRTRGLCRCQGPGELGSGSEDYHCLMISSNIQLLQIITLSLSLSL